MKKSWSNFEIAITLSIFELERRTKAQNVGDSMAYIGIILNFQYMFRFKRSPEPQNGCQNGCRNILDPGKSMFDTSDVIGDVTT